MKIGSKNGVSKKRCQVPFILNYPKKYPTLFLWALAEKIRYNKNIKK